METHSDTHTETHSYTQTQTHIDTERPSDRHRHRHMYLKEFRLVALPWGLGVIGWTGGLQSHLYGKNDQK